VSRLSQIETTQQSASQQNPTLPGTQRPSATDGSSTSLDDRQPPSTADLRLPRFLGIGPARSGTTWMHSVLESYVALPRIKETDFFTINYSLGLDWYLKHFPQRPSGMAGEIAPSYFDDPMAPSRVHEHIPQCKIISSLRDPVGRIYSHYRLLRSLGWISRKSFEESVESHLERSDRPRNLVGINHYASHLRRWLEYFGAANVLVVLYDDLERDPQSYINQITRFIGIPDIDLTKSLTGLRRINVAEAVPIHPHLAGRSFRQKRSLEYRRMHRTLWLLKPYFRLCARPGNPIPPLQASTARRLREYFLPEVEAVEPLIGRDLSAWKIVDK
jgi:Sulfotransferase domain